MGSKEKREAIINLRNRKCSCGKTTADETVTCVPAAVSAEERARHNIGSKGRCGCDKDGKICLSHCMCDPVRCANRPGGVEGAKRRIAERSELRSSILKERPRNQRVPLKSLLATDSEPSLIEASPANDRVGASSF